MSRVYGRLDAFSIYRDRRSGQSIEDQTARLQTSKTLYVGNLSFYTSEGQIYELFSRAGSVRRIIMGLDRLKKNACGFCFVEYYNHDDALDAMKYISGTKLDDRLVRADLDPGFEEGRQYGRGRSGGQVRDEHRTDYDEGRGGYGRRIQQEFMDSEEYNTSKRDENQDEENPRFKEDRNEDE